MPLGVFISYAHKDRRLRDELAAHLSTLRTQGVIRDWWDGDLLPGSEWEPEILERLNTAQIILLLISADFLASTFCTSVELQQAIAKHNAHQARVIPIILRSVDWEHAPFAKLQVLPVNGKPVNKWPTRDEAFKDIVKGIRRVIEDLDTQQAQTKGTFSHKQDEPLWNVPYPRNPLFIGRENVLTQLHDTLTSTQPTALVQPQAINGLGGIGKTQTALEYAYRHRDAYQAVFWVNADTHEALITDFAAMATLLQLPEQHEQDQRRIVMAVKRWLETHHKWLIILDNADEISTVTPFLPVQGAGHVLLTTRAHALGMLAQGVEIEQMEPEEGVLFLLRRAKLITPTTPLDAISAPVRAQATDIVAEVGGLPLALDQAGAYIEETSCSLSEYLYLYQTHRAELLKARGVWSIYHPEPVATTWAMALEKVQQTNPAAVDLLNLCAFLAPDDIPEEIFLSEAAGQDTALPLLVKNRHVLNAAIKVLLTFSFIRRNTETQALSIHRLVQAVIKDEMTEQTQRHWAEYAVRAVNRCFPYAGDVTKREQCHRYLLHALACDTHIRQRHMLFPEAARLLQQTGPTCVNGHNTVKPSRSISRL